MLLKSKNVLNRGLLYFVGVCVLVLVLAGILFHNILTPFLISSLLAYLADPWVEHLVDWGLPRVWSAALVFLLLVFAFVVCAVLLVPLIQQQIIILVQMIPDIIHWFQLNVLPLIQAWTGIDDSVLQMDSLMNTLKDHWRETGGLLASAWKTVSHSGMSVLSSVMSVVLVPVLYFYLLRDWPKLTRFIRELPPRSYAPILSEITQECLRVLRGFFRGQLLVMTVVGTLNALALRFLGLKLGILIGLMAGVLGIVPYLGFITGLIAAVLAALVQTHSPILAAQVAGALFAIHLFENVVLSPWFVGDSIGLHPVWVIFSVLAGGELFGLIGVLLALPVTAVFVVVIKRLFRLYRCTRYYLRT